MNEPITYVDSEGNEKVFIPMGQGPARLADADDLIRDANGFTHPYLHRRIDPQPQLEPEVKPRDYGLSIGGNNSFRTTKINTHDENSTTTEIP